MSQFSFTPSITFEMINMTIAVAVSCIAYVLWRHAVGTARISKLPPGPRRLPLLGNLFDLPRHTPWLTFQRRAKQYGAESRDWTLLINDLLFRRRRRVSGGPWPSSRPLEHGRGDS